MRLIKRKTVGKMGCIGHTFVIKAEGISARKGV